MDGFERVKRDSCGLRTLAVVAGLEVSSDAEQRGTERMCRAAVDADCELIVAVGDHIAEPRARVNVADRGPGFAAAGRALLDACH